MNEKGGRKSGRRKKRGRSDGDGRMKNKKKRWMNKGVRKQREEEERSVG